MQKMSNVTNKDLYEAISNLEQKIEHNFVRNEAFEPVRKVVYGLVGAILAGVIAALLALIIRG